MKLTSISRALAIGIPLLACIARVYGAEIETPSAPSIDGTWRWTFTMPDGTVSQVKLLLETEEGQLTGNTSFRAGTEAAITNVVLNASQVRFQVIRQRDGRDIVTTYWGAWSGKTIRGKVSSNWAGETQTYNWEAQRDHEGVEGLWRWTVNRGGRRVEQRVKLEQDGETLTGSMPSLTRGGRRMPIHRGSLKDGEIYFELERGAGESKVQSLFRGKQTGNTIKGTIEVIAGGRKSEVPWVARRIE